MYVYCYCYSATEGWQANPKAENSFTVREDLFFSNSNLTIVKEGNQKKKREVGRNKEQKPEGNKFINQAQLNKYSKCLRNMSLKIFNTMRVDCYCVNHTMSKKEKKRKRKQI